MLLSCAGPRLRCCTGVGDAARGHQWGCLTEATLRGPAAKLEGVVGGCCRTPRCRIPPKPGEGAGLGTIHPWLGVTSLRETGPDHAPSTSFCQDLRGASVQPTPRVARRHHQVAGENLLPPRAGWHHSGRLAGDVAGDKPGRGLQGEPVAGPRPRLLSFLLVDLHL